MNKKYTYNLDLDQNELLGFVLEQFDPLGLPANPKEGRVGYHTIWKIPIFHDGFAWQRVATEEYVSVVAEGLAWKDDCRAATTANIDIVNDLNDGDTIDGVTLSDGDRVLVKNQTDKTENGIWIVSSSPVRSSDMDESSDFNSAVTSINEGTVNGGLTFRCLTINPSVNVDDVEFSSFGSGVPDATETVKGKTAYATLEQMEAGESSNTAATPEGVEHVLGPVRSLVEKLVPTAPADLSGQTLSMVLYSAKEASTGTDVNNLTDDTQPEGLVEDFYDGDEGTLSAEVDAVQDGSKVLSTGDDSGTYDSLIIVSDEDPYAGQQGKEGFYKQLDAKVKSDTPLTVGEHTYQMKHSITGDSALLTFIVDDPAVPTITGVSITLPPSNTRYISGVPSLEDTDTILVSFDVNDAVKTHYATNPARVTGTFIDDVLGDTPVTPPDPDAVISYVDIALSLVASGYIEDLGFSIYGVNSKGEDGTESPQSTSARMDTVSDESGRMLAGSGEFPTTGVGAAFDSTQSLKTVYTEELQLLNGKYQLPRGDYTLNQPTAGEDYSVGMGLADRWYYHKHPSSLSEAVGFTINILDAEDFTSEETVGIKIYARIVGVTGWIDCNKAYAGSGDPSSDGDAAMIFSDSDGDTKRVTFGSTPRSGDLEIRIAIESGEVNKKFSGINITNIT